MSLRVLDLFSGIGGFSLGLERTGGFQTVAFCEIEDFPRRVLAKHWPGVPCYRDVRELTAKRLAADGIAVDVICGGFPCQDISLVGKGAGLAGERSGLWSEVARLVGELRPKAVLLENVSALLGRGLGDVLGDLAALGYDATWECIPASAVGAPHRRDRIWIVADAAGSGLSGRVSACLAGWKNSEGYIAPSDWWATEPELRRVVHGVPDRTHRLAALGNAVVPQIPELIGRAILASIEAERLAA
jgi:DNA (cytosine-5)-methyltransferase 1